MRNGGALVGKTFNGQTVNEWMEENAEHYSIHSSTPIYYLSQQALAYFNFAGKRSYDISDEYADAMQEKRYKQAEKIFKRCGLDTREDGE